MPSALVPSSNSYAFRSRPLTIHGTGQNTRNFLYVEDVARAFDVILHKGDSGRIYNIGGSNEYRCAMRLPALSLQHLWRSHCNTAGDVTAALKRCRCSAKELSLQHHSAVTAASPALSLQHLQRCYCSTKNSCHCSTKARCHCSTSNAVAAAP